MPVFTEEYIRVRTSEFLVKPGEDEEIFNEGTYGDAFSTYLEIELNKVGYSGGAVLEDWGYWLGVSKDSDDPKALLQIGVYCLNEKDENPMEYVALVTGLKTKRWDWSKFKFVSFEHLLVKLQTDLKEIIQKAPKTEIVSITDDMPG